MTWKLAKLTAEHTYPEVDTKSGEVSNQVKGLALDCDCLGLFGQQLPQHLIKQI